MLASGLRNNRYRVVNTTHVNGTITIVSEVFVKKSESMVSWKTLTEFESEISVCVVGNY